MNEPVLRIRRRNLPHWTCDGATYFVTFRAHSGTLSVQERELVMEHYPVKAGLAATIEGYDAWYFNPDFLERGS